MNKHTPGPWAFFRNDECFGIATDENDGLVMARMVVYASDDPDLDDERQEANARVMAAAAELLEEASYALEYLDEIRKTWGDEAVLRRRADGLRAAIAKAKGE